MRKSVIFALSLVILFALFSLTAMASNEVANYEADSKTATQGEENSTLAGGEASTQVEKIKEYLKEKILPVAVGVLTAVCALLATLGKIKKAMCDLAMSREELKKEAQNRDLSFKEKSEYIQDRTDEIKEILKDVPELENNITELKEQILTLKNECEAMAKILSCGFLQNKDVITSGAGKRIAKLVEEISRLNKAVQAPRSADDTDDEIRQNTAACVDNTESALKEAL